MVMPLFESFGHAASKKGPVAARPVDPPLTWQPALSTMSY
jgi:hypothetical protein